MNLFLSACVAATAAIGLSTSAAALTTPVSPCALTDITPNAQACSGYFAGNLLNGNAAGLQAQKDALALIGLNWDTANWSIVDAGKDSDGDAFGELGILNGLTWIGIHYGAGRDGPVFGTQGGGTAFYRFDAGTNLAQFGINQGAISSITLYETGGVIPEPATWAMMIAGFGLVGSAMRRRRGLATVNA